MKGRGWPWPLTVGAGGYRGGRGKPRAGPGQHPIFRTSKSPSSSAARGQVALVHGSYRKKVAPQKGSKPITITESMTSSKNKANFDQGTKPISPLDWIGHGNKAKNKANYPFRNNLFQKNKPKLSENAHTSFSCAPHALPILDRPRVIPGDGISSSAPELSLPSREGRGQGGHTLPGGGFAPVYDGFRE